MRKLLNNIAIGGIIVTTIIVIAAVAMLGSALPLIVAGAILKGCGIL